MITQNVSLQVVYSVNFDNRTNYNLLKGKLYSSFSIMLFRENSPDF